MNSTSSSSTTSTVSTVSSPITNLVEPMSIVPSQSVTSSPNIILGCNDNSPLKNNLANGGKPVKHTVKDTFSAKILLEMRSAPSSPLPSQSPPSPSIHSSESTTTNSTTITTPTSPVYNTTVQSSPLPSFVEPNSSHDTANNINNNSASSCSFKDCLLCKRGTPFVNNQSPTWACIMKIVFFCLQHEMPQKLFLNLKIDVYGFMTSHWHLLCLDKKRSDNWHKQIQDMLSHSKNLFESGMDVYKQNGYWRMKTIADPWDDIKFKKSSSHHNSSASSSSHVTKRKRSYSENDSFALSPSSPTPISNSSNSNSSSNLLPSSPIIILNQLQHNNNSSKAEQLEKLLEKDSSSDELMIDEPNNNNNNNNSSNDTINNNNSNNNSSNIGHCTMMSDKSIDKQIHDNFNQLSYQLKLKKSPTHQNQQSNTCGGKKKLKAIHNQSPLINLTGFESLPSSNSNSVIPPLPMIPSYLSVGDIPSSPSLNFPSPRNSPRASPKVSPRYSPSSTMLTTTTTTTATASNNINGTITPPSSSASSPTHYPRMDDSSLDNNGSNDMISHNNTHQSDIEHLQQQDRISETLITIDNNKSLNSSYSSSSSSPSSPLTSSNSSINGDLTSSSACDEISVLKDQIRQITENLRSIKDNTLLVGKDSISLMIEKEIDRLSSLLSTNNNTSSNSIKSTINSSILPSPIISTNNSNNMSHGQQKSVEISINFIDDCNPSSSSSHITTSGLSGLSALSMACGQQKTSGY